MRRWLLLLLTGVLSVYILIPRDEINLEERKKAVVAISSKGRVKSPGSRRWYHFHSMGTGFFVSPNGYIVTAAHVVEPPEGRLKDYKLTVEVWGVPGLQIDPHIIYVNKAFDMAVLKIELNKGHTVSYFELEEDEVKVGDKIYAMGHPRFLKWTYMRNMIANKLFVDIAERGDRWLYQLEDSIPQGISGGPAFNESGKVVCMPHVALVGGIASTVFCVPSTDIKNMLDHLGIYGR